MPIYYEHVHVCVWHNGTMAHLWHPAKVRSINVLNNNNNNNGHDAVHHMVYGS